MLPSLCCPMAANPFVSRFPGPSVDGRPPRQRFALGFRAASWQHRYLDCGTLNLSGRCGRGTNVALSAGCRQEGAASGRRLHGRGGARLSADTSVPKQREAGLGEFESWLPDAVLRDAPAGMAFLDTDLRFVWVNAALARMYDRPVSDFTGQPIAAVWPAVDAARGEAAARQVLAQGRPAIETFETGAAGQPVTGAPGQRTFHWFGVRGADDALCGAGLIVMTGGTGPATEEALRRSEERYRALVQGGAQIIWVASPDGEMLEDSAEWRWITGQTVEEFLGNGWLDSIHPEDRERVERDWRECLRSGRIFDDRFRMRARGGAYRHYDVRAVPIEREGKIAEWVGACTDVTSQRQAGEMGGRLPERLSGAGPRAAAEVRGRLVEQLAAAALPPARLQQATSMLAEALTVEQVVEVITEVGRTAIGALRSAVVLLDTDGARLKVVNKDGLPSAPDSAGGPPTLQSPSVITRAIATRKPVLVEDPDDLRRQFEGELDIDPATVIATSDERSWVGLPLITAGAPLGALRFSFGRPRKISQEEQVFLEALAGPCGLAVERAGLYEREHTTAETLQRSLLPDRLPDVPGLILTASYLPVARNMEIGGDWYDAFRLADQRLAVAVGDVMGKGLTAAAGVGRGRNG